MKRSSAITKLRAVMFWAQNGDDRQRAEEALKCMEDLGMKPPVIPSQSLKPKDYKFGSGCSMHCICHECDPNFPMYQWESE